MASTRIKKVYIEKINIPLEKPFTIAIGKKNSIKNVLMTVVLENGIEGYGEAAPLEPINGESQATVMAVLDSLKDSLVGEEACDYRTISRRMKSVFWAQVTARCAVEMALMDAYAKSLGLPLYQFLGGAVNQIETDYTVDIVPSEEAKAKAARIAGKGYRVIKIKVGQNPREDVERVAAIREGAPGCGLTLDANQGYSPCEAVRLLENLDKISIRPLLFEQPVVKTDLAGMKFVKDRASTPVAADESVFTSADAINIVRTGCADVINIKLMKSGIVEALDIAAIARSANIRLMMGCMLESRLALGCAAHFAAGLGGFDFVDLDTCIDPLKQPLAGGPEFKDPLYTISDELPGIGMTRK